MRNVRILILAIVGLFQINNMLASDYMELDGLRYNYISFNGGLTSGYGVVHVVGYSNKVPQNLVIPRMIKYENGLTTRQCDVLEITAGAFANCNRLLSVNTNCVKKINERAFANCVSLRKVSFGTLCNKIASKAFTGCVALDTIYYKSGISVAADAFDEETYQNAKLIVDDAYLEECNNHEVWSKFQHKVIRYSISISTSYGSVIYNGISEIKNESKSFSALEGSAITLSFMPENGRELANLIVGGNDVTSEVTDNQYRINNVSESVDIQVSFFSITISAKGNGNIQCVNVYAYNPDVKDVYRDTRNEIFSYIIPKDWYYYFYIIPDEGYQLSKVTKDGTDITSDINVNYPIMSNNINYSSFYEFIFEEIPPVTHTLSIKSIGNGSVLYNENSIREVEKSFSVEEGLSPVLLFTPDAGHRIKSVKLNGTDVSLDLSNNKYTINNMNADTSIEVMFEPILHSLTIVSSGFGEASYNNVSIHDKTQVFSVLEGTSHTISFTPDAGYRIASVILDETDVTASVINNTYTIRNISADMKLSVTFEKMPTYTLSITTSGNGLIYFNNTTVRNKTEVFTITGGADVIVTFTPDIGYCVSNLKVNGTDVTLGVVNNQYTINNISANTTITVTFGAISHMLSITASGNGYVSYNNTDIRNNTETFTVNEGTTATVTFAPDTGYRIKSVKLNTTDITSSIANSQYTIRSIDDDVTLEVEFEAIPIVTYSLSIKATGHGAVVYNGTSVRDNTTGFTINEGTSPQITLSADEGYRVASVKLNNADVTSSITNNSYTINNVSANTSLEVVFEAIPPTTYSLDITAVGNGAVTYNSSVIRGKTSSFNVNEGTKVSIALSPDNGYRIKSVKENGTDVIAYVSNQTYVINTLSRNTTVEVEFEAIPIVTYSLNIKSTGNGSVAYNGTLVRDNTTTFTVNEGTSPQVTLNPDEGYRVASVKLNNADVTSSITNNSYTINNVSANTSLEVVFEAIPPTTYLLDITAVGNGAVTYNSSVIRGKTSSFNVNEGTKVSIALSPDNGYRIKSVKENDMDVTAYVTNQTYVINSISRNTTIEVKFEAISIVTYSLSIKATGHGAVVYNGTSVRDNTTAFTVNKGTSPQITLSADEGYRVASVKLNNADVTSSITNNSYTINNVSANTSLEVVFEAIPPTVYSLDITAVGNGAVTYNSSVIRGKTSSFNVNEGTKVSIALSPDNGYRIKSVKENGTDVTAYVSNQTYVINTLSWNTTVEVEFEAIPIVTYSLNIKSTGNGSVAYNGTLVRDNTTTFTVNEGTSPQVTLNPDEGYRVASVKLNNVDVTANVFNNRYTIANISADANFEVTFESIPLTTYSLTITASGNGSVAYGSANLKNQTQTFTVNEGDNASLTISPESGFRIASVKMNNIDVTAQVLNNLYTISKIITNTTVSVTFEAIPVVVYQLSLTANGNGSATYNGTAVRGETKTFAVNEGTDVTISFSPDNGNSISSVKVNGNDVTADVVGNHYTINGMSGNMLVEVTFMEDVNALTVDGVNYTVTSQTDKTICVTGGNYGQVLTVPASVNQNGQTWTVTGIENDALKGNTDLTAVIWNAEAAFTASVSNPNLLLYVKAEEYAPNNIRNVVVNGTASNITLVEALNGNDFYCPQAFVAQHISFTHHYGMTSGVSEARGWESIALPFGVQTITHASKGTIVPFEAWNGTSTAKPFWLYEMTGNGFVKASEIKAYTPYIISMPNNSQYTDEWLLNGNVTFEASGVYVDVTDHLHTPRQGYRTFVPCFSNRSSYEGLYALNVNNDYSQNQTGVLEGSRFVLNMRQVHPFEAYMTTENNARAFIPIFEDGLPTDISDVSHLMNNEEMTNRKVYNLNGQQVQHPKKGVYIINGKKVVVK